MFDPRRLSCPESGARELFAALFLFQNQSEFARRHDLQCLARGGRRRTNHTDFDPGLWVDRGSLYDVADDRELEIEFPLCAPLPPGMNQAARLRRCAVQTASSAATSAAIISSVWIGDGVKRRRSVPRGTVGKLIG